MPKVIIIGGGVSGLSAGIYSRINGLDAVICEKHFKAGGNLTGWDRSGYHIDNCIHWLTGTNPSTDTYRMWEQLGALGDVQIYQGESLFTCERDGQTLSMSRNIDKFRDDMLKLSPADEKEINSFIKAVKAIQGIAGIAGENHNEKISAGQLVSAAPHLLKLYRLTTGELAARFEHPLIKEFFTAFFTDKFMALMLAFVCAHYCGDNGGVPVGGSTAMAQRMADRFESLGGDMRLCKEASKINFDGRHASSVTFTDGTTIDADYVIVTTDPAMTFGKLLNIKMPKSLAKQYKKSEYMRFSSIQSAFSCDTDTLPFKGDYALEIPTEYRLRLGAENVMVREFSHEKDFSPSGKSLIQAMAFCGEDKAKKFIELRENREEYAKRKRRLSEIISSLIEEKFPELKNKLNCLDVWTPATYRRYVGSEMGSWMSFALSSNAPPLRKKNLIPGLDNVIMASQWLMSPGGLPIAADGGRIAVETIMKKERKKFKM